MANEVTFTGSLTCSKPSVTASAVGRSFTALVSSMNGNFYFEGSVLVPSTGVALSLGSVTQPRYAVFYNNPTFNAALTQPTTKAITGAVNNGSGLVRITAVGHGYLTNDLVTIAAVGGTTEANGTWPITVISSSTFDLVGSAFVNAYTSGGTALLTPSIRLRNGAGGADLAQLLSGDVAILPLFVGSTPYAIGDPTNQLLEYLVLSY